jgi:hypothetical protein
MNLQNPKTGRPQAHKQVFLVRNRFCLRIQSARQDHGTAGSRQERDENVTVEVRPGELPSRFCTVLVAFTLIGRAYGTSLRILSLNLPFFQYAIIRHLPRLHRRMT